MSFTGAVRVARYSWPLYAGALVGTVLAIAVASWSGTPPLLRWAAVLGMAVAVWLAAASFLAFHWIFDRSELTRWEWLRRVGPPPARWVHISAGLEETNAPVAEVFPGTEGKVLDIFDPTSMPEPALGRAREQKIDLAVIPARLEGLPVPDGWAEGVFVVLAAHEIRKPSDRERFFVELRRILSPTGRLVLIEHPRNLAGALAFGPGVLHFLPVAEWPRLARHAGFTAREELRFSPFVRVYVYAPSG